MIVNFENLIHLRQVVIKNGYSNRVLGPLELDMVVSGGKYND